MRVLVCGGRDFDDERRVQRELNKFYEVIAEFGPMTIIHGGACGADNLAARWAYDNKVPSKVYPAQWGRHGKAAGPIRNNEMLKSGVDWVIAFPGGNGTEHMKTIARKAGVPVIEG